MKGENGESTPFEDLMRMSKRHRNELYCMVLTTDDIPQELHGKPVRICNAIRKQWAEEEEHRAMLRESNAAVPLNCENLRAEDSDWEALQSIRSTLIRHKVDRQLVGILAIGYSLTTVKELGSAEHQTSMMDLIIEGKKANYSTGKHGTYDTDTTYIDLDAILVTNVVEVVESRTR